MHSQEKNTEAWIFITACKKYDIMSTVCPKGMCRKNFVYLPVLSGKPPVQKEVAQEGGGGALITESQNGRGWKGPLWVIYSNPPAEAGPPTVGCRGPCPGGS